MKARVIIERGRFVPQVKYHWWQSFRGICDNGYLSSLCGLYNVFMTLQEAIDEIKKYEKVMVDNGKVVWQNY